MEDIYAVIDMKSFYASCECAERGLNPFCTPLVVADPDRSLNTIVMSCTPFLKEKYHCPNVCRISELPPIPDLIIAKPRMRYYLEQSARIVSIFLDFISEEDLHVYSVDESFLRLTPYLSLYRCTAEDIVRRIQCRIQKELRMTATAGLGPNMFLAKVCLDNEGKKKPPFLARWGKEDVETKLWAIHPITKIWGISNGISSHLSRLGIHSLRSLAHADDAMLKKEFGIIGKQLKDLANGIDESKINEKIRHQLDRKRNKELDDPAKRKMRREQLRKETSMKRDSARKSNLALKQHMKAKSDSLKSRFKDREKEMRAKRDSIRNLTSAVRVNP